MEPISSKFLQYRLESGFTRLHQISQTIPNKHHIFCTRCRNFGRLQTTYWYSVKIIDFVILPEFVKFASKLQLKCFSRHDDENVKSVKSTNKAVMHYLKHMSTLSLLNIETGCLFPLFPLLSKWPLSKYQQKIFQFQVGQPPSYFM